MKKAKGTRFLSNALMHLCIIILYITKSTEQKLNRHIKDCFKTNGKQKIIIPKKREYVKFKDNERKIKSSLIIYADFGSILVLEDNEKQNPKES